MHMPAIPDRVSRNTVTTTIVVDMEFPKFVFYRDRFKVPRNFRVYLSISINNSIVF